MMYSIPRVHYLILHQAILSLMELVAMSWLTVIQRGRNGVKKQY